MNRTDKPDKPENRQTIQAILWDLDGVIVDSGEWHYAAYVKVLAKRGVGLTRERYYSSLFGRRNWDILRDVLGDLPDDEIREIAAEKERTFRELARRTPSITGRSAICRASWGRATC